MSGYNGGGCAYWGVGSQFSILGDGSVASSFSPMFATDYHFTDLVPANSIQWFSMTAIVDCNTATPGAIAAGGGTYKCILFTDGTNWRVLASFGGPRVDSAVNYSAPTTGFSLTLGNNDWHVILDPSATIATGTVTLCPAPVDGQIVDIRTSQQITTLTIAGNGATVKGYTAGTLALGGVLTGIYKASNTTWYF